MGESRRLRLHNWDRLRVVAALDTVALHIAGEHALWGFGLPLFLMLSVALSVSKKQAPFTKRFVSRRAERLLLPWAFWSLVIVLTRAAHQSRNGEAALGWVKPEMLLYGPRIHLWFLPFIVVLGLGAHLWQRRHSGGWAPVFALVAGLGVFLIQGRLPSVGWPFDQWLFSLPALPFGFALGRAMAWASDADGEALRLLRFRGVTAIGFAFVAFGSFAVIGISPASEVYAHRFLGAAGALVLASWLPNRNDRFTEAATPWMLGVYILHPVVYLWLVKPALCYFVLGDVRWLRVVATFPLTMLIVAGLLRTPLKRFL